MRTFLVIGLSSFGMDLAKQLASDGQKVYTIDRDESVSSQAQQYVYSSIIADARELANIKGIGLGKIDAGIICLGSDYYGSLQVIMNLKQLEIPEIIVKIFDEEHGRIAMAVGATRVVLPERDMAERLAMKIGFDNAIDIMTLGSGVAMAELAAPSSLIGKTLAEAELGKRFGVQILAVKELLPERTHLMPSPDMKIKDSDILVVTGDESDISKLRNL